MWLDLSGDLIRLHYFVAKLFRILHAKFYHNRPSFAEDMTNTFCLIFFLDMYVCKEHLCLHRKPYIIDCHGGAMGMYHCARENMMDFNCTQKWVSDSDGSWTVSGSESKKLLCTYCMVWYTLFIHCPNLFRSWSHHHKPSQSGHVLQWNIERLASLEQSQVISVMTFINYVLELCHLTKLADGRFLLSDDDNAKKCDHESIHKIKQDKEETVHVLF